MSDAAPHVPTDTDDEEATIAHGVVVGSVVGVILSFAGATAGMVAAGVETGAALGFGAFVAFWGGLGFGSMMGGVLGFIRAAETAAGGDGHGHA